MLSSDDVWSAQPAVLDADSSEDELASSSNESMTRRVHDTAHQVVDNSRCYAIPSFTKSIRGKISWVRLEHPGDAEQMAERLFDATIAHIVHIVTCNNDSEGIINPEMAWNVSLFGAIGFDGLSVLCANPYTFFMKPATRINALLCHNGVLLYPRAMARIGGPDDECAKRLALAALPGFLANVGLAYDKPAYKALSPDLLVVMYLAAAQLISLSRMTQVSGEDGAARVWPHGKAVYGNTDNMLRLARLVYDVANSGAQDLWPLPRFLWSIPTA